nr:MAG TPA: hypothetical protein [Bacteriophage sp.]
MTNNCTKRFEIIEYSSARRNPFSLEYFVFIILFFVSCVVIL